MKNFTLFLDFTYLAIKLIRVDSDIFTSDDLGSGVVLLQESIESKLCKALPSGLNDGLLCARGIQSEENSKLFSGSCQGDSGGPLIGDGVEDKRTLIGIVSGEN